MKEPKITPRGKQILVKPDPEESRQSASGLITPSNVEQEQKAIGIVVAVGKEVKDIKKGERVIYATFGGERLKFKDGIKAVDLVLLPDEDVLAFIE